MRAYYLTGAAFALSNVALRRLKIARFSDLNDPFELLAVDLADRDLRRVFRETKDTLNEDKGLICLSTSWSNPLLWGHYAEKHSGIALGFDVPDSALAPVMYRKTPLKIPFDRKTRELCLTEDLMNKLLRTKFSDWEYEKEMRHFVQLDHATKEAGMYFYDFSAAFALREVILGPRCELPIERVRALVSSYSSSPRVIKARIAFSSFRVIKNKLASRRREEA